jgi:hypothetical protein
MCKGIKKGLRIGLKRMTGNGCGLSGGIKGGGAESGLDQVGLERGNGCGFDLGDSQLLGTRGPLVLPQGRDSSYLMRKMPKKLQLIVNSNRYLHFTSC